MVRLYSIFGACFNATVNVYTRLFLIMLSACVYHWFVIAEVFLNSYYLLYPPLLEKTLGKTRSYATRAAAVIVNVIAGKVISKT